MKKNFEKLQIGKFYLNDANELFEIIETKNYDGLKYVGKPIIGLLTLYYEDGTCVSTYNENQTKKNLTTFVENKTIYISKVEYGHHFNTLSEEIMNYYTTMGFKLISILKEEGYKRWVYYFEKEYKIN